MGQANSAYVQKSYDEAINLIMEVIRYEPNGHEPYSLLALIYEELGDLEKSFGYYSIAAHLTPKDAYLWKRLADMSKRLGKTDQTAYYMSKALRADSNDHAMVMEYVDLLKSLKRYKKVIIEIFYPSL
jgi:general transcription factor 3C polypeptide 3 (transcription factor C subunit 4)